MSIIDYKNHICRDTNVVDEKGNVYIEANGRGQGCNTVWFKTVRQAQKFIDRHGYTFEIPKEFCLKCSCNYSSNTKKFIEYPPFNCGGYKEKVAIT